LTNFVQCYLRAAQTRQIEGTRALGVAGRRVRKRSGVTELQPELGAVFAAISGKFPEPAKVGGLVKYQIAGVLGVTGGELHLTDYGYGQPTSGPALIQPELFGCRMAGSVA
jgi:hypothetical protein